MRARPLIICSLVLAALGLSGCRLPVKLPCVPLTGPGGHATVGCAPDPRQPGPQR